jgi:26S proteasome non-ATPase regulatory subunit 9
MEEDLREALKIIDVKRKSLETEADAIVLELTSPLENGGEPMGIDTPLVDEEGYPRADIDVYRARTLRSRLNIIRTDHKALTKQMEESLQKFAAFKNPNKEEAAELEKRLAPKPKPKFDKKTGKWVVMNWDGSVAGVTGGENRSFHELDKDVPTVEQVRQDLEQVNTAIELIPFARINFVAPDSPAAEACLEENDLILAFGGINHENHNDLQAIGELVPKTAADNKELEVQILRQGSNLFVKLKPRPWHGRGLLGCHIVPYSNT